MNIKEGTGLFAGRTIALIFIAIAAPVFFIADSSCVSVPPVDARITSFTPASGVYFPEDEVISSLQLKNTGRDPWTFWVGYSVRDQAEQWYDIDSHPVALNPGEESKVQSKAWQVSVLPSCLTGDYIVAMAVWDAQPEDGNAVQLAYEEKQRSFQVLRFVEHLNSFDADLWKISNHRLGRSKLAPDNVEVGDGRARIRIPAGTLDGGEFGSTGYFEHGTYRIRMLVPSVHGSLTGFFLYRGPGGSGDEIDIEIYNDGDWQIAFTTWSQGDMTNTIRKLLPFDPSAEYHEYRIDFYPQETSFFVDGQPLHSFISGLPEESMRLLVNTWFPDWLSASPPSTDKYTCVDWIKY